MNSRNLKQWILIAGMAGAAAATSSIAQGLNPSRARTPPTPRATPEPQKKSAEIAPQAIAAPTSVRPASQQELDQIVAVVNGQIITKKDQKERVDTVHKTRARAGTQLPPPTNDAPQGVQREQARKPRRQR